MNVVRNAAAVPGHWVAAAVVFFSGLTILLIGLVSLPVGYPRAGPYLEALCLEQLPAGHALILKTILYVAATASCPDVAVMAAQVTPILRALSLICAALVAPMCALATLALTRSAGAAALAAVLAVPTQLVTRLASLGTLDQVLHAGLLICGIGIAAWGASTRWPLVLTMNGAFLIGIALAVRGHLTFVVASGCIIIGAAGAVIGRGAFAQKKCALGLVFGLLLAWLALGVSAPLMMLSDDIYRVTARTTAAAIPMLGEPSIINLLHHVATAAMTAPAAFAMDVSVSIVLAAVKFGVLICLAFASYIVVCCRLARHRGRQAPLIIVSIPILLLLIDTLVGNAMWWSNPSLVLPLVVVPASIWRGW